MNLSPSFSLRSHGNPNISTESLSKWVVSFCVMKFDLEQGQLIEECYPPGLLTKEEELEIAFSSFPDSVSRNQNKQLSSVHDSIFFFRFLRAGEAKTAAPYLYGYVFNRQRHDERLKRGGEQKSVVILSLYPYSSVFRPLLQIVGPLYFDVGKKALELIAAYVSQWPPPSPGKPFELPIGNSALKVQLPGTAPRDSNKEEEEEEGFPFMSGLFHDTDIFGVFKGILLQLWVLWELMLVGEPILVISPTPSQCCEAVASLINLASPLPCSVDYRPYFTIHDPEFAKLNSLREGDEFPPMVLGVTNLFFLKALRRVPHVISVGNPDTSAPRPPPPVRRFSTSNLLGGMKFRKDGPLSLMVEHREAIWSGYVPVTKPDTSVLNRLVDVGTTRRVDESVSIVNNEILRRHFTDLTTNFLSPFSPLFKPNPGSGFLLDQPPALPPFNSDEFLKSLSSRGGPGKFLMKRMRSNWIDLYRRFIVGPNFRPWFERKRRVSVYEQRRLWRDMKIRTNVGALLSGTSELERIDDFNAIERHLKNLDGRSSATAEKLREDLRMVFNMLPHDMQQLLLSNPDHAHFLH